MQLSAETLQLLRRQADLEIAMRSPGGIRVTAERELLELRALLSEVPAAVRSPAGLCAPAPADRLIVAKGYGADRSEPG